MTTPEDRSISWGHWRNRMRRRAMFSCVFGGIIITLGLFAFLFVWDYWMFIIDILLTHSP